jgi:hypothetical protein
VSVIVGKALVILIVGALVPVSKTIESLPGFALAAIIASRKVQPPAVVVHAPLFVSAALLTIKSISADAGFSRSISAAAALPKMFARKLRIITKPINPAGFKFAVFAIFDDCFWSVILILRLIF